MHEPTSALRERRPAAAGASRREALLPALLRTLTIAIVAALFLAFAGAFGTAATPLPQRLGYWIATMVLTSLIGLVVVMPIFAVVARRPITLSMILALLLALPLTLVVWFLGVLFSPGHPPLSWRDLPKVFPPVLLVCAIMTAVNYLAADRARRAAAITHASPPGSAPPKFLERLPVKLRGGELYAVQAEDHYLRLHTSRGSDLILMRLADAVAELDGLEGAQTHRSWWVAKAAVADAKRSDGRAILTLTNGVEAPVSRSYAGALREAGWF